MWGRVGRKPAVFFETPAGPHGCETNAPIPLKWGSTKTIYLSDGKGQNNNIAIFDTWVQGHLRSTRSVADLEELQEQAVC